MNKNSSRKRWRCTIISQMNNVGCPWTFPWIIYITNRAESGLCFPWRHAHPTYNKTAVGNPRHATLSLRPEDLPRSSLWGPRIFSRTTIFFRHIWPVVCLRFSIFWWQFLFSSNLSTSHVFSCQTFGFNFFCRSFFHKVSKMAFDCALPTSSSYYVVSVAKMLSTVIKR